MTLSLPSRRLAFLLWSKLIAVISFAIVIPCSAQQLAAYHDNQGRFYIFDNGKTIEAEYLSARDFSIGGRCILYTDSRGHLKMYYKGVVSELEVNSPTRFEALDFLSVYSIGGIVKIIDNGKTITISTNSVKYEARDSLVTFYDASKELLAVYYKHRIHMLEDGLAGKPANNFKAGDNLVAYVSSRTQDFKIFYNRETRIIEPFLSGGSFKTGRDIVAYVNYADNKFRIFYRGEVSEVEDFPPMSFQMGDGIAAYVDNLGSFRAFIEGETVTISSFRPDFYQVRNSMIIYGEEGYFKVWYNNRAYTLETFIPNDWQADWNTIVYRDLNRNVKIFSKGDTRVLTYDIAEDIKLYRDVIVVNKGMNIHNVYWQGKKY